MAQASLPDADSEGSKNIFRPKAAKVAADGSWADTMDPADNAQAIDAPNANARSMISNGS